MPVTDGLDLPTPLASAAPRPKSEIRPVTIHLPPDDFGTVTRRGVGFRARCGCGEQSRAVASYAMARGWLREHRRGCRSV